MDLLLTNGTAAPVKRARETVGSGRLVWVRCDRLGDINETQRFEWATERGMEA